MSGVENNQGRGGEPLSFAEIGAIIKHVERAAIQAFGVPYELGLASEYLRTEDIEPDKTTGQLSVRTVYSQELGKYVPEEACVGHITQFDHETWADDVAMVTGGQVLPRTYKLYEEIKFRIGLRDRSLAREVTHGWYNANLNSWAMVTQPAKRGRQVKDYSAKRLNQEAAMPIAEDIKPLYVVLRAFGLVDQ